MNIQYIDNVCRAMMIAKDIIIAFLIFFYHFYCADTVKNGIILDRLNFERKIVIKS